MNIKKIFRYIQIMDNKKERYDNLVEKRWKKLLDSITLKSGQSLSFGSGHYVRFELEGDFVCITTCLRGENYYTDKIHISYFENESVFPKKELVENTSNGYIINIEDHSFDVVKEDEQISKEE